MLPRRLCVRLATIGSRPERLAVFRNRVTAGHHRFSSATSAGSRSAPGESKGYANRRGPTADGSGIAGGRHITSTAVSVLKGRRAGGATSSEVRLQCVGRARHVFRVEPTLATACSDRVRNQLQNQ